MGDIGIAELIGSMKEKDDAKDEKYHKIRRRTFINSRKKDRGTC